MEYLLRVLLVLESVHIHQAGECQIEYCQICTPSQQCSVCDMGRFGQKCEYECRADSSTCSLCRDSHLKAFKSEAECSGCREQEYFSKGDCLRCPGICASCVDADICDKCYDGYFGLTCSDVCPGNCRQCFSQYLCLSCKEGWSGSICQCSSNCIQEGNQFDWCNINGTCLKGCVHGKRGIRCDADCPKKEVCLECDQFDERCLQCSDGLYGSSGYCDKTCGHCKPNNEGYIKCNLETGECDDACVDGYHGRRCDQECAQCLPDEFDVVSCDIDTGNCRNGCVDGFYGSRCDEKCEECVSASTSVVNYTIETGECMDGFYGRFCDQNCNMNCFEPSTMSNRCDKISGNCTFGCIHGWFGDMCDKDCSTTCLNTSCDQLLGKCNYGCIHGWFGDTCQETCKNTCLNGTCTDENAFCIDGCVHGWYGATCNETCSKMCFNRSCDQQFGHCDYGCVPRFYGDMCESRCSDNCEKSICNRQTSQCSSGCEAGFEGPFCNSTQPLQAHLSPVLIGIISGIASVMTIFVCILITWILVRLRIKQYYGLKRTTRENTVSIYDEIDDNMMETTSAGDNLRTTCNLLLQNTSHSSSRLYTDRTYDLPFERDITTPDDSVLRPSSDNSVQLEFPVVNVHNSILKTDNANDDYEIPFTTKHMDTGSAANKSNVCCGNEDLTAFSILSSSDSSCVKEKHFSEQFEIPHSKEYFEFGYTEYNKTDRQNQSGKLNEVENAKSDENISKIDKSLEHTSAVSEQDLSKTKLTFETERNSCNYLHPIS